MHALEEQGWRVLARNWRGGGGELDVVVCRGRALRIVEVKARKGDADPLFALSPAQQGRLRAAGEAFLAAHEAPIDDLAFLLAAVRMGAGAWSIEWLDDAFDG